MEDVNGNKFSAEKKKKTEKRSKNGSMTPRTFSVDRKGSLIKEDGEVRLMRNRICQVSDGTLYFKSYINQHSINLP